MPCFDKIKQHRRFRNIIAITMILTGLFGCSCDDTSYIFDPFQGIVLDKAGAPLEFVYVYARSDELNHNTFYGWDRGNGYLDSTISFSDGSFTLPAGFPTKWYHNVCGCSGIITDPEYKGMATQFWYTFVHPDFDTLLVVTTRDSSTYSTYGYNYEAADTIFVGIETFNGAPGETWHLPPVTMKRKQ